jgi:hypothetical protein
MPGFDGTGPRGRGPLTGRGEGYCALVLPEDGQAPFGYAGLQGRPGRMDQATAPTGAGGLVPHRSMNLFRRLGRAYRRGRRAVRGRSAHFARW